MPVYISSMSDYQVRALSGSFAPTNGTSTITSVTPAEWQTSDPEGGLSGIIRAWSGGFKAITGTRLFVHGGGHHDSANNGVYIFEFDGTDAPTGWTVAGQSAVSAVVANGTYSDGRPQAVHTYDGAAFHNGFGYRFGGSQFNNGGAASGAWKFNASTGAWTSVGSMPSGQGLNNTTTYDPVTGKILIPYLSGAQDEYVVFRTSTDTFSAVKTLASGIFQLSDSSAGYDSSRSRSLMIGGGFARLITVNWTAETATISTPSLSSSTPQNIQGPSCFYDAAADRFWVFGGTDGSAGWSNIYEIHPTTFVVTAHALSGSTISVPDSDNQGSFGRFVFMPAHRAVGVIAAVTTPAYVIKLPAAGAALNIGTLEHDGPATPEQISLYLPITGTLSSGTTVTVRYKTTSASTWTTGHSMYRIQASLSSTPAFGSVDNAFAWPIIGLTPGVGYDVEVTISDGVTTEIQTDTFTTRALPAAAGVANKTIAAGSSVSTIQTQLSGLSPGDVIQFATGTYNIGTSDLNITGSGTTDNPIYIRGASRTGVIISGTDRIFQLQNVSNVIFENFTITGSGVDGGIAPGNSSVGFEVSDPAPACSRITIRNITMTGVDRAVGPAVTGDITASEWLVYDNSFTGNNLWTTTFTDSNLAWDDDGINLPGQGNCAFNNTLIGFGDTMSYASHSSGSTNTEAVGVHYYRNDIRNGGDDGVEVDHAHRNCSFYDNRLTNTMTSASMDPLYGGPFLYARNISINAGRQPFKWNSEQSGMFVYSNTIIHTTTLYSITDPPAEAGWYQANNGDQESFGYRNNILIYLGSGTRMLRFDNATTSHTILDFTHNAWAPNLTFGWPTGVFASLAAAQAGLAASTPVFSGSTQRHASDVITTTQPFTTTITLGTNYRTEVTASYTPTLAGGTAKNSGVVIANITDGYSGAAPDRGAIIAGLALVTYGDSSTSTPPAAPTGLRFD